jgi:hypothetical protein
MAFNPSRPVAQTEIDADELRAQFNALKALNDGLPTSPQMMDVLAAQTAGACPDIQPLNLTVSNPPTQAQTQAIADKVDEILAQLQRQ